MTEFLQEIAARLQAARRSLDEARLDGDDYLIQVRTGEIESLQRLMDQHGTDDTLVLEPTSPAAGTVYRLAQPAVT